MNADDFRRLALSLPRTSEGSHMGHPDFRVDGRIFATVGHPDDNWAMVRLTPTEQRKRVRSAGHVFVPVPGAWGRKGSTRVQLQAVEEETLASALAAAWSTQDAAAPAEPS